MEKKKSPWNHKRIAALTGVILLAALYIVFFFVAIFAPKLPEGMFMMVLVATIFIPLLVWVYIWLYGVMKNRHTIASFDLFEAEKKAAEAAQNPTPLEHTENE